MALALLWPVAILAADNNHEPASWQGSKAESRTRSGNPKLQWGSRAGATKSPSSRVKSRSAEVAGSSSLDETDEGHVVPAAHQRSSSSRISLREVATKTHKDEQVEQVGAPLLRSALQPSPPAALEDEEAEMSDEGRSYDELPMDEEVADDAAMENETESEEPAPLDRPDSIRPAPTRRPPPSLLDDEDDDQPNLLPEPANAPKRPLPDCDAECPKRSDPTLFRELMAISLNMRDPAQELKDAPSDYIDADGLGPDDPVFTRGEKFVPRPSFRRCWNDANGEQFQGWYVKHDDGKVLIIDEDKKEHWLAVDSLSLRDRRYLYHLPNECPLDDEQYIPRAWCLTNYTWKASSMCHKPLYFEQVNYERYGHTWGPIADPILQSAHFFTSIAFLPYKMGIEPPQECIYPLGYYRPNSCAPYMLFPVPLSLRGAVFQAGAVTGVAWLFH